MAAAVKNLPANAGDMVSSPGPGRSHMPWSNEARVPQLLSLRSRAREPQLLSLRATATEARTPRARALQQRQATAMRRPRMETKSSPCSLQLEKPAGSNEDPTQPKINGKKKKKRADK